MEMDDKNISEFVPENDPERCAGVVGGSSQCRRRRVPNSQFCPYHGGNRQQELNRQKDLYDFSRTKYLHIQQHISQHSQWRSVQEEIGVLRITLQAFIERCEDQKDLLVFSSNISDLVDKIRRLVLDSVKLDQHLETLIDKERVIEMANEMVEAVRDVVKDPEEMNSIILAFKEILLKDRPKVKVSE